MSWFRRRYTTGEFAEAIRPELRELPSPEPAAGLLDRILASRRSGARIILPATTISAATPRRRLWIPAAVVAALLLTVIPFLRFSSRGPATDASSISRVATEWLPGSVAIAQTDAPTPSRPLEPLTFDRPAALRPVRLSYLRTWREPGREVTDRMTAVVSMQPVERDGIPAWLVVSRHEGVRKGLRRLAVDSIHVARDNLRLLRHTAMEQPYSRYDDIRIEQLFRSDSVIGGMRARGARMPPAARPIAQRLLPADGPYLVDGISSILLGAVNLHAGWSRRAAMLGWAVRNDDVFRRVELLVDGEETVTVPAGRFDCWRLTIYTGRRSLTYWARKADGVGVRSLERDSAGVVREVVLSAEQSP